MAMISPTRHSGARVARARNPYSLSWLWIPGSLASLAPRNDGVGGSMPGPKNLPRFGRRSDLAPGAAGASGDFLDQLPVGGHLLAVGEIERVLEPGAQMPAEIG